MRVRVRVGHLVKIPSNANFWDLIYWRLEHRGGHLEHRLCQRAGEAPPVIDDYGLVIWRYVRRQGRARPVHLARLISTASSCASGSATRFQSSATPSKVAPRVESTLSSLSMARCTCSSPERGADLSPDAAESEKRARSAYLANIKPFITID